MNNSIKLYIVGNDFGYGTWLSHTVVNNMDEADLVIFTGGEDVDPAMYNEDINPYTRYNTDRDIRELVEFNKGVELGKPMLGICRGSQFLTVVNGGKLVQHVNNHGLSGTHSIQDTRTSKIVNITSTHHQMMYPFDLEEGADYIAVAKSEVNRSDVYIKNSTEQYKDIPYEPEIVFYTKSRCLCIQGHPEYMHEYSDGVIYCKKLINEFLLPEKLHLDTSRPKKIKDKDLSYITTMSSFGRYRKSVFSKYAEAVLENLKSPKVMNKSADVQNPVEERPMRMSGRIKKADAEVEFPWEILPRDVEEPENL